MNYIENTIDIFNLPFTLKDFSEYSEGYLATFSLDIPFDDSYGISHKLFSNIAMFISILEQKGIFPIKYHSRPPLVDLKKHL